MLSAHCARAYVAYDAGVASVWIVVLLCYCCNAVAVVEWTLVNRNCRQMRKCARALRRVCVVNRFETISYCALDD